MQKSFLPPVDQPRFLLDVPLKPIQSDRFQPTGFPDLGPGRYSVNRGDKNVQVVLVESPQSMANHLESMCFDPPLSPRQPDPTAALADCLSGMPFVQVDRPDGTALTNSILEAHRLNSPYILEGADTTVLEHLKSQVGGMEKGPVDIRRLAQIVFAIDPNAVLHGIFIAKSELAGGRLRLPRLLSGFIEATNAEIAYLGGVKNDHIDPSGDTKKGFGNVPFGRTEFTGNLTAFFNFDLTMMRGYRLGEPAERFLFALAMFKIRRFLSFGLRLRTACDLIPSATIEHLPSESDSATQLRQSVAECTSAKLFKDPPITRVIWGTALGVSTKRELPLPTDFPKIGAIKKELKPLIEVKLGSAKKPGKIILKQGLTTETLAQISAELPAETKLLELLRNILQSDTSNER